MRFWMILYKLKLATKSKIHPIFHVSQLKRVNGAGFNPPTQLTPSLEMVIEPTSMLKIRKEPEQPIHALEVLIKWRGL